MVNKNLEKGISATSTLLKQSSFDALNHKEEKRWIIISGSK